MNINELIPGFSRFKKLNLGLKRLLFVIGIPLAIFLSIATINGDRDFQGIWPVYLVFFTVIYWLLYWISIRIAFWVYDGFLKNDSEY